MASKTTNKKQVKSKTRTSAKTATKSNKPLFRWWMVLILVAVVAVVGVLVVRLSEAATQRGTGAWNARVISFDEEKLPFDSDRDNIVVEDTANGQHYHFWYDNKRGGRVKLWWSFGSGRCVSMTKGQAFGALFKDTLQGNINFRSGDNITVWEQNPAECYSRSTKSLQSN